jgi:hypothetical protein
MWKDDTRGSHTDDDSLCLWPPSNEVDLEWGRVRAGQAGLKQLRSLSIETLLEILISLFPILGYY